LGIVDRGWTQPCDFAYCGLRVGAERRSFWYDGQYDFDGIFVETILLVQSRIWTLGVGLLEEYNKINIRLKEERLPSTRKEFEDRARLFHLMQLIEEFLTIKKEYIKQ
jgi:hypothetical protein